MKVYKSRKKVIDMLGLLTRAPRTVAELVVLTGMSNQTVRMWLNGLVDEGLASVTEVRGGTYTFTWTGGADVPKSPRIVDQQNVMKDVWDVLRSHDLVV